jgi:hypothetical protein
LIVSMIIDNQNLFGSDPNKEPGPAHAENYRTYVTASGILLNNQACGPELNPNRSVNCMLTISGATVYGVPLTIPAGKYNVTELMPLPLIPMLMVGRLYITHHFLVTATQPFRISK